MGSRRPTIGVVVTCFNYADYVGLAIDSLLAQSRPADEIIVVDDGSTDLSREIIAGYNGSVRPLFQANAGHVAARNNGFLASTADIIMFLDADDVLLPDALAGIEGIWSPAASKAQFDLELIDAQGRALGRRFCNFPQGYDAEQVAREFRRSGTYRWPVTSGNAYARWFIERLMPMNPPQSQDGMLNTIAPLYGPVLTISKPLGQYRLHTRNVSRRQVTQSAVAYPDFPRRIAIRRAEFALLHEHAAAFGVSLPGGDPLDQEIVFVNYRLMARKLRKAYAGSQNDTNFSLSCRGIRLALSGPEGIRIRLTHVLWFSTLLLCPAVLAQTLIQLRFDRVNVIAAWRARLQGTGRAPPVPSGQ